MNNIDQNNERYNENAEKMFNDEEKVVLSILKQCTKDNDVVVDKVYTDEPNTSNLVYEINHYKLPSGLHVYSRSQYVTSSNPSEYFSTPKDLFDSKDSSNRIKNQIKGNMDSVIYIVPEAISKDVLKENMFNLHDVMTNDQFGIEYTTSGVTEENGIEANTSIKYLTGGFTDLDYSVDNRETATLSNKVQKYTHVAFDRESGDKDKIIPTGVEYTKSSESYKYNKDNAKDRFQKYDHAINFNMDLDSMNLADSMEDVIENSPFSEETKNIFRQRFDEFEKLLDKEKEKIGLKEVNPTIENQNQYEEEQKTEIEPETPDISDERNAKINEIFQGLVNLDLTEAEISRLEEQLRGLSAQRQNNENNRNTEDIEK